MERCHHAVECVSVGECPCHVPCVQCAVKIQEGSTAKQRKNKFVPTGLFSTLSIPPAPWSISLLLKHRDGPEWTTYFHSNTVCSYFGLLWQIVVFVDRQRLDCRADYPCDSALVINAYMKFNHSSINNSLFHRSRVMRAADGPKRDSIHLYILCFFSRKHRELVALCVV